MKLTDEQVLEIRALYLEGSTQMELAKQFSTRQGNISKIVRGIAHSDAPKPEFERRCRDCKAPLDTRKKRCEPCHKKWQHTYFAQWYQQRKANV